MTVIRVDNLVKEYKLGQLVGFKQTMLNGLNRLAGRPVEERKAFRALDDVSFSVEQSEVVGIIGHNGAGKSTLLKVLSRVTTPTSGSVSVKGKVAPLIEVGAGLNPELTGRENVFLNATILGIPKPEIRKKFDDIVAFAELDEFIDTPLKRYSSGMKVKLGFAIATSIDAEILIVDEVLAVGDLAFQRKCFGRMEDLIKRRGNTVLLVSHNIRQIERLCTRVLLLERGRIHEDDLPNVVCDSYYARMNQKVFDTMQTEGAASRREKSSGEMRVLDVATLDEHGERVSGVRSGGELRIRVEFELDVPVERPEFHIGTHTTDFFYLTGSSSALEGTSPRLDPGKHVVEQVIPSYPIAPGTYGIRFAMLDKYRRVIYHGDTLALFTITAKHRESLQDELRIVDLPMGWRLDGVRLAGSGESTPGRVSSVTAAT